MTKAANEASKPPDSPEIFVNNDALDDALNDSDIIGDEDLKLVHEQHTGRLPPLDSSEDRHIAADEAAPYQDGDEASGSDDGDIGDDEAEEYQDPQPNLFEHDSDQDWSEFKEQIDEVDDLLDEDDEQALLHQRRACYDAMVENARQHVALDEDFDHNDNALWPLEEYIRSGAFETDLGWQRQSRSPRPRGRRESRESAVTHGLVDDIPDSEGSSSQSEVFVGPSDSGGSEDEHWPAHDVGRGSTQDRGQRSSSLQQPPPAQLPMPRIPAMEGRDPAIINQGEEGVEWSEFEDEDDAGIIRRHHPQLNGKPCDENGVFIP
ncbi:hypothetical protein CERSUDRAFT_101264 [Gelatoporia subvermispora B]|uniref:Uncharacterized protein n=1 Tax=Ceriporiopsis subvermispora (strain B) TaxID=914234 RepID=M2QEU9_CERS8|nr:hypothetical protein CERSUDRAFT_101264 [Gelatoporia subvermispora B]